MRLLLSKILFCYFLFFGFSPLHGAENPERQVAFRVAGDIYISYREGIKAKSRGLHFVLDKEDDVWAIVTEPHEFQTNTTQSAFRYFSVTSDGKNIYRIAAFNEKVGPLSGREEALKKLRQQKTNSNDPKFSSASPDLVKQLDVQLLSAKSNRLKADTNAIQAGGSVNLGAIPRFNQMDLVAPLWLAYCGGADLKKLPPDLAPAFFDESVGRSAELTNFFVHAKKEIMNGQFQYPKEIWFTNNGALMGAPLSGSIDSITEVRSSRGFSYAQGHFQVLATQIFNGIEIPSEFILKRYVPIGNDTTQTQILFTISCKVREIQSRETLAAIEPANVSERVAIKDHRMAHIKGQPAIGYIASPGSLKSTQELVTIPEFKRDVATFAHMAQNSPKEDRKVAPWFFFMMFFLLTFPLGYILTRLKGN